MANIYILTLLDDDNKKYCFSNLKAIFLLFDYEELHITYKTLANRGFKKDPFYKNKHITIEKMTVIGTKDAKELKIERNKIKKQ